MAGSINLSLTQRYDKTSHEPLDGGKLYFYAAGTSTPQDAYQDISLTIPWPNPITLDSGGNVPQLFFDDGYIKFRLANSAGVTQLAADYVLVMGPTAGAGAAPSVDATTIMATGDIKARYATGTLDGFVRANGRTIGSASSGATERANTDCEDLFSHLWTEDTGLAVLTVSGGRGASAAADWAANKTITLPDFRSRALAGLGGMGNSDNELLSGTTFTLGGRTTLGSLVGAARTTLVAANVPEYTPTITVAPTSTFLRSNGVVITANATAGGVIDGVQPGTGSLSAITATASSNGGSSTAFDTVSPIGLVTIYVKL